MTGKSLEYRQQEQIEYAISKKYIPTLIDNELNDDLLSMFRTPEEGRAMCHVLLNMGYQEGKLFEVFLGELIGALGWSPSEATISEAIDVILENVESELYSLELRSEKQLLVIPNMHLDLSVREDIIGRSFMPPMLVEPKDWKITAKNDDRIVWEGGYLTEAYPLPPVLGGRKNAHKHPIAVDALNILQRIPLVIDPYISMFEAEQEVKSTIEHRAEKSYIESFMMDQFHFVWQFDKRGRMYSHGWQLNVQGREYKKALLSFATGEYLTDEGRDWVYRSIGSAMGYDKDIWSLRYEKGKQLVEGFQACVDDLLSLPEPMTYSWLADAVSSFTDAFDGEWDEPFMVKKLLFALFNHDINGEMFSAPVGLDSTGSGIQIQTVLAGCEAGKYFVNLTDVDERVDPYNIMVDHMVEIFDVERVTRGEAKDCLMTHYYNSVQIPMDTLDQPQLEAFYSVTEAMFPGCEHVMDSINRAWEDKPIYKWTLPDGHTAFIRVRKKRQLDIEVEGVFNFEYNFTEEGASGNFRHLAPNIIHSIDAWVAREVVRRLDAEGIACLPIHDCFYVHPNHVPTLRKVYTDMMRYIDERNILHDIISEITEGKYGFTKLQESIGIADDNYSIC